ncbi:hypothetical protein ACFOY2_23260 [Nonomuraea purpurea]|uniref:DUF222 domain-containing protein n=1 Tax=Nonomuraea purpurea TaxID=1849276 RepID=A0ABV8GAV8_9ACTN
MTRYAIDRAGNTLIAQWSTGSGNSAAIVADLPRHLLLREVMPLAASLTELSQVCWRCYTHPASAADHYGPDSLRSQREREREREALVHVLPAMTTSRGAAKGFTTNVERAAHATGHILRTLDAPELTVDVVTEVGIELAAIEQAELGDLSERAQQAVVLTREDVSPLQLSQADTLLRRQPLGSPELFTQIDPTAAAIAAAHWLHAAVTIAAQRTGTHPAQVVAAADRHDKPHVVTCLTDLMGAITAGGRPRDAVMSLIRHALDVAEGHTRGIDDLRHRITTAEKTIEKARVDHPDLGLTPDTVDISLTPLDPSRPAPDLLENLLNGIQSCWRLYRQHDGGGDTRQDELRETFLTALRQEAATRHDHLL